MEELIELKEKLVEKLMEQAQDLEHANTCEMGEVVDMVKDLSKAIYNCKLLEVMNCNYTEENFNRHIQCILAMGEEALSSDRTMMIQHLTEAIAKLQNMK